MFFYSSEDDPENRIPDYLHSKRKPFQPILILADPGYVLYNNPTNSTIEKPVPKGNNTWLWSTHGWNPADSPGMQTIFYAYGPAFKGNVTMDAFESVNVYPLLAHLLGIKPRPNNGSLNIFKHVLKEWVEGNEKESNDDLIMYASIFGAIGALLLILMLVIGIVCFLRRNHSNRKSDKGDRTNTREQYKLVQQA